MTSYVRQEEVSYTVGQKLACYKRPMGVALVPQGYAWYNGMV